MAIRIIQRKTVAHASKNNSNKRDQVGVKFHVEAGVALAKASIFLLTAEDEMKRHELIPASICAYYSVFHLSLALMWFFADELPEPTLKHLIDIRDRGDELPTPEITHRKVKEFLGGGQLTLSNRESLYTLFKRAQEIREFTNYGPRVTYSDEKPIVGPCRIYPLDVENLINKIRPTFSETIKLASPSTGLMGSAAVYALHQSISLMETPTFPFINWSSEALHSKALKFLKNLTAEITKASK